MKTTLGGDRLGSGNKQKISMRNYERSTHDLSSTWRSSMAAGTLVPFMSLVALPGDSFDIDLGADVKTLPTVGPLFGSYKVQMDVFQVPIRLYNAALHMNKLGIGMDMSSVELPKVCAMAIAPGEPNYSGTPLGDNVQINKSALLAYLGIKGVGRVVSSDRGYAMRYFNGVPFLGYWDIYKNYYSNKQEERGMCIHTDDDSVSQAQAIQEATVLETGGGGVLLNVLDNEITLTAANGQLNLQFGANATQPDPTDLFILVNQTSTSLYALSTLGGGDWTFVWQDGFKRYVIGMVGTIIGDDIEVAAQTPNGLGTPDTTSPAVREFDLANIDKMREGILQAPTDVPFIIHAYAEAEAIPPYSWLRTGVTSGGETLAYGSEYGQELLGLKTYQSDLFNNWISTEWIDGTNGVNEITAVDTTGDSFTIDALNLANKVYTMLNRIALSGGTYDDWLDAVYTHERVKSIESPMYLGSLIREIAFEEVISTADTQVSDNEQPLGTLAGRGRMTQKNKGGRIVAKIHEPSYLMGIASITPRVDYSQGNSWDVNLETMNDFHKPALDAIGFQDLITEQMAWQSTNITQTLPGEYTLETRSAGKQPAWINYMTAVNETFGNFADENKEMFMTLNRRYEINQSTGEIDDLTTYIDPSKFNQIFAQTNLDAQNFWVQISKKITARRKMSAKVIPNL